jgi:hypothetical protein
MQPSTRYHTIVLLLLLVKLVLLLLLLLLREPYPRLPRTHAWNRISMVRIHI